MEYHCISADSHIDLCWLPHDVFVANASPAMRDRMPYVTVGPGSPRWVTKSGVDLGFANGKDPTSAIGNGSNSKYVAGKVARFDRMAATGLYEDGARAIFRPTTPALRIRDQDRDGIQAEVLYGLHGSGIKITDRETAVEFYRIYNDWLSNFCSYDRKRFVGLACIPSFNVEVAEEETRRVAKLGLGGLDFLVSWDMTPLWDPYWDPFWKAAVDANMPVHFHTIAGAPPMPLSKGVPPAFKLVHHASLIGGKPIKTADLLGAMIFGEVLERYPDLRIVLGESGIGWIPYVLERMDDEYENRYKATLSMTMKPSDYWRRQCRATFQKDVVGTQLLNVLGIETVMWASDYPHGDSFFPDSQECIQRQFGHLPDATQRKIICENAGKFYGLMAA